MLATTPENFRSEMARHRLSREAIAGLIGMHENELSMFVNAVRPLSDWAGHNIGWAINHSTGMAVFNVDMTHGPVVPPRGRPKSTKLPVTRRRQRRWAR